MLRPRIKSTDRRTRDEKVVSESEDVKHILTAITSSESPQGPLQPHGRVSTQVIRILYFLFQGLKTWGPFGLLSRCNKFFLVTNTTISPLLYCETNTCFQA